MAEKKPQNLQGLADLEEQVVEILELPSDEQPLAFEQLRARLPEHADLLVRLEQAANTLVPGVAHTLDQIGPYRILDVLGEGGMGIVYLAEQSGVVRQVALKVIKLGMDSKQVLARFEVERRALGLMNHDCIAKVFDAGMTETGQPYFVMEHVPGLPLTDYCDTHKLTLLERIDLFREICAGVQHAHQKGVIHRDLKPSNIIVVRDGERVVPKIIDFGLARATDRQLVQQTLLTVQGQMLGTPEYMSPEQTTMDVDRIDTRTDVWSLGVVLYELLTGELPFQGSGTPRAGSRELERLVCEEEPPKPSTRVSTASKRASECAQHRQTSVHGLVRQLRGDLDWIVTKAMSKEPERRYATAAELSMDLKRHLDHEPVLAGPPGTAYRIRKFVRRYRLEVASAALVFITAVAGALVAWDYAVESEARAAEVKQENTRFNRLAVIVRLQNAAKARQALGPAWPESIQDLERWLVEWGRPLRAELPQIRQTLQQLEEKARGEGGPADEADEFLQTTLQKLEKELLVFLGDKGSLADVEDRFSWARRIAGLTLSHPQARTTWEAARQAILKADGVVASKDYQGQPIDLQPQWGLVPIGMNPVTKLWEFYHLRSAWDSASGADPAAIEVPAHREDGRILVGEDTGVVFVLIPGGTFIMGAQSHDENGPNFDRGSRPDEGPVHRVPLSAFFLARHELTQGQWSRLSNGEDPSLIKVGGPNYLGGRVTLAHPVEHVNWFMSRDLVVGHGLALPTEAQWERGCRAGTETAWFSGSEPETLHGFGNVLDRTAKASQPQWIGDVVDFADDHVIHAPAGSCKPNALGLHNTHGNVWEWCQDSYGRYELPVVPGNGEREVAGDAAAKRVNRGGSFHVRISLSRSGLRHNIGPSMRSHVLGLRVARAVRTRG